MLISTDRFVKRSVMGATAMLDRSRRSRRVTDAEPADSAGQILLRVFETLDQAGIRYCVLHGYAGYPNVIGSDVDCVVESSVSPRRLVALLAGNSERIGATIVRSIGYHIVLAGIDRSQPPCFVTLDFGVDCQLDDVVFLDGTEVLASRRRHGNFWIPAPGVEFGCYLARSVAKRQLNNERASRLSGLYEQDPLGCNAQIDRFWSAREAALIRTAAQSKDWTAIQFGLGGLGSELRRQAILRRPTKFIANRAQSFVRRLDRVWRPNGVSVVLLGPDGAGKSSLSEALGPLLAPVLPRSVCWGFAPPVLGRLRHRRPRSTSQPHGLPPRSHFTSLLRAAYWVAYDCFNRVHRRLAVARSTLVLFDRHFIDILVDARRYRYGGPAWLLRLIWRLLSKPDLIVLLDAPTEVLQGRKQEVSFEETARQRLAYQRLVREMGNGHVVNADQPLNVVAAGVARIILDHLGARAERRSSLLPTEGRVA